MSHKDNSSIPCIKCPVLVMCKNKPLVRCSILFKYFGLKNPQIVFKENERKMEITRVKRSGMDLIARFLNKEEWSIMHNQIFIDNPIQAETEGPAVREYDVAYRLSNGAVVCHNSKSKDFDWVKA